MRISDWSSDVCSSDLVDADADHQPLQALRRICFGLQQNAGDFAAVQQNVVGPLVGDLEERRADGADRLAQGNRGDEAELRGFGQARSEEHTSELQSLMRISYAVFCLKKKK